MAPHGEAVVTSYPPKSNIDNTTNNNKKKANSFTRPPRLSNDSLQRTISDISFELLSKDIDEELLGCANNNNKATTTTTTTGPATALPPISEVENAKCDCCGMEEEYTPEYITKVRDKFMGKWLCGLCSEAVKEEMDRSSPSSEPEPEEDHDHNNNNKTQLEKALEAHMSHCAKFNKLGRAFPVLCQAEAMRDLLKRSKSRGAASRAKSMSPKDYNYYTKGGVGKKVAAAGISRSSSCIPALTREINDVTTNFTANN